MGCGRKTRINITATPAKRASSKYSRRRKVLAPLLIRIPTLAIVGFEEGCFFTQKKKYNATPNAMRETIIDMM
jgi:hypothetical protein